MRETYLNIDEVKSMVGVCKTTIYRLMDSGEFPKQVKISPSIARWRQSDLSGVGFGHYYSSKEDAESELSRINQLIHDRPSKSDIEWRLAKRDSHGGIEYPDQSAVKKEYKKELIAWESAWGSTPSDYDNYYYQVLTTPLEDK